MSAARRVVALARVLAWRRVRGETLEWLAIGVVLLMVPSVFGSDASMHGQLFRATYLAGTLVLVSAPWTALLRAGEKADADHLPVVRSESAVAFVAAEACCGCAGALAWVLAVSTLAVTAVAVMLGAGWIEAPSEVAPVEPGGVSRVVAAAAAGFASAVGPARDVLVAAVIGAIPRALGRTPDFDRVRAAVSWCVPPVFVAAVWVLTGRAELALIASAVWLWVDPDVAEVDRGVDCGLVPRLEYGGRPLVSAAFAALAVGLVEVAIRVAPAIATVLPSSEHPMTAAEAVAVAVLVRGLVVSSFVAAYTMRSEVVHPGLTAPQLREGFGEDLLRYERHLPLDPVARIDRRWRRVLPAASVSVAAILAWCFVAGSLGSPQVVDATLLTVFSTASPMLLLFVRYGVGARTGDRGRTFLPLEYLLYLLLGVPVFALIVHATTSISGTTWMLSWSAIAVLVLVATAGSWAWARRRWST